MRVNPFADGENGAGGRPAASLLVIFGASGDLTQRKLIPALYNLFCDGYLPQSFVVLGAARSPYDQERFRSHLREGVVKYSRREIEDSRWREFAQMIFYQRIDGTEAAGYGSLRERIERLEEEHAQRFNLLYYLATAADFFGPIAANLKSAKLVSYPGSDLRSTRLLVEKPFGHDLDSARELNAELRDSFEESQIFRLDHYLGKETVQNILAFRFANGIFEPLWNRRYVEQIQVSFFETVGVENRAAYFDQAGILRDIVQNHLLQVLALLCIEPPLSISDPDSIRDEKLKVLKALHRYSPAEARSLVVRGQYGGGFIQGVPVAGYREEKGVAGDSQTETFVALQLGIDNWRWEGVPIYVRAAKRMPKRITEVSIFFKKPAGALFKDSSLEGLDYNVLAIQIQPEEGISLSIASKPPGPRMRVRPVVMNFSYGDFFGIPSPDAYERLLLDAMKGDATLFTRADEIEEAWELVMPVLESWADAAAPALEPYEAGAWGPKKADDLLAREGHSWRKL